MRELHTGEIHLWWWRLDADEASAEHDLQFLSPTEQKRADEFLHPPARTRFIERRAGAKRVLASYGDRRPRCTNCSSSGDRVILAVSDGPVGVDIEKCVGRTLLSVQRYLHPSERAWLQAQPDPERAIDRLWVCKESYLKFTGEGLHRSLSSFLVTMVDPHTAIVQDESRGEVTIHLFDEAGPCTLAVASVGAASIERIELSNDRREVSFV